MVIGSSKIEFEHRTGNTTLLGIDSEIPIKWMGKKVEIAGKEFSALIVYDLPNHIAVKGVGSFLGKTINFLS